MQQSENSAYLKGSLWDFKGRKGELCFLLFLLPFVGYFSSATMMYCFLYMNKNIKLKKKTKTKTVECSCPEVAAISRGCLPLPLFIFFSSQEGLKEPQCSP